MTNYMPDRSCVATGYIYAITNALQNSLVRIKYYESTNDTRFLDECNEWLDVANLYMKEIKKCPNLSN